MCLARRSGGFKTPSTWLGGVAPTKEFCAGANGCDLFLPDGFTLSTESLNGELDIQFNVINIAAGGTLQLGTASSSAGFRFKSKTTLNVFGTLTDVTGGTGGIQVPLGSGLNLFSGSEVCKQWSTFLRTVEATSGATVGSGHLELGIGRCSRVLEVMVKSRFDSSNEKTTNTGCFSGHVWYHLSLV